MADEPNDEIDLEALQEQLALVSVEQFLSRAASTIASLAYAKLERGDLRRRRRSTPWRPWCRCSKASWRAISARP